MINTYISDLLYRYDCVIVPEFGAFLAHQKSATIELVSNVFLPPRKEVSFNEQLQQNDGLLANHIAVNEKCSYTDAQTKIAEFVRLTKGKLISGEIVLISKIGHFSLNNEGKLQFTATNDVNYLTTSFGLSSSIKTPILREVYKEEVEILEEKSPIIFTPERKEKRKKQPYLQYAAAVVIGLGMFGIWGNDYVNTKQLEVVQHNEKINADAMEIAYQKATIFDINPIEMPTATLPVRIEKKNIGKYHIVAGAFRFEENALKKITLLDAQGFEAKQIGINKYGLHQVVYASYEDRIEALSALRNIKKSHNSQAWLLVKEMNE